MKKLIILSLICCLVLSMSPPVSADYFWYKDVSADDLTNALVDYCNGNTVRNMTEYEFELSNHDFKAHDVVRTKKSLDFKFECEGEYFAFLPVPLPFCYSFAGMMHVDKPQGGLKKPYALTITDKDTKFIAVGENWRLDVWDTQNTRFKV